MSEQKKALPTRHRQVQKLGRAIIDDRQTYPTWLNIFNSELKDAEARGAAELMASLVDQGFDMRSREERVASLLSAAETWFIGKIECPNRSPLGVLIAAMEAVKKREQTRIEALEKALSALTEACEQDFTGPCTADDPDEESVASGVSEDGQKLDSAVKFGHIRQARAVLDS